MIVSCLQLATPVFDREENYAAAERAVRKACETTDAPGRPDLLLLTELWNIGRYPKEGLCEEADPDGERTQRLMGGLAKEYGVNIAAGSVATLREGRVYNTAYAFDRQGRTVARYDKIHRYAPMHEDGNFCAGDSIESFILDGVRFGFVVCYDIRFPELSRRLYLQGAEVLLAPTQGPVTNMETLRLLGRARAVENECLFICCNCAGHCFGRDYAGGSYAADQTGALIARMGNEPGELRFEADIDSLRAFRCKSGFLASRRPEYY